MKDRVQDTESMDRNQFAKSCAELVYQLDKHNSALEGVLLADCNGKELDRVLDLIHLKIGQSIKELKAVQMTPLTRTGSASSQNPLKKSDKVQETPKRGR